MQTKPILAIDTASPSPGVTLLWAGEVFDEPLPADRHASELLLAAIETAYRRAGVVLSSTSRIAACSGPGSFTGVRVGLATAWGLGRALDCPVEAVSTLEVMAEAARDGQGRPGRALARVACALDAGRGEIVWGAFDISGARAVSLAPAARAFRAEAAAALGELGGGAVVLPSDLLGELGIGAPPSIPLSRALALALEREPSDASTHSFSAVYSRPSAAEEKRGAP